jgi:2,4-dichlorophenol 6-monooxygenase
LGGEAWAAAAASVGAELGIEIAAHVIGPRRNYVDHSGDWARVSEVEDSGCILVRPDHHVAWRAEALAASPAGELRRVLRAILAR